DGPRLLGRRAGRKNRPRLPQPARRPRPRSPHAPRRPRRLVRSGRQGIASSLTAAKIPSPVPTVPPPSTSRPKGPGAKSPRRIPQGGPLRKALLAEQRGVLPHPGQQPIDPFV